MTTFRYIETAGLPPGFDIADLIDSGVTGDALRKWAKDRIKPGAPVAAPKKNPPKLEAVAGEGAGANRGEVRPQAQDKPASPPPSSAPARSSNVVPLRKAEPEPQLEGIPVEYSHDALAEQFSALYSDKLLYVAPWNRWMEWTGSQWKADETLHAKDLARGIARKVSAEAATRIDLGKRAGSIAHSLSAANTIGAIEQLARTDRRHAAAPQQFDADPWALNTPGGIVDLRTGKIRPATKQDFATKMTAVAPSDTGCPTWLKFLDVATNGDSQLIEFMRRMAGYCLTGSTRDQVFFFVYGTGGNGKGTFMNTLDWIFADYAKVANMDMFVEQKFNNDRADVAGLVGARMVTGQEIAEGTRWNEKRIKEFTGGDTITAKFLYANPFEFLPQFKLVFSGNHKPSLRNVDEAIKRRLYLIPFTVTVPAKDRDPHLGEKLRAEAGGILQWCIDGCLDWQENLLAPPDAVLATTGEYFEAEDTLGTFFEECCEFNRNYQVSTTALYARYGRWCEATHEYALPRKRWLEQLAHRAMTTRKQSGNMVIEGVRLASTDDDDRGQRHF